MVIDTSGQTDESREQLWVCLHREFGAQRGHHIGHQSFKVHPGNALTLELIGQFLGI